MASWLEREHEVLIPYDLHTDVGRFYPVIPLQSMPSDTILHPGTRCLTPSPPGGLIQCLPFSVALPHPRNDQGWIA